MAEPSEADHARSRRRDCQAVYGKAKWRGGCERLTTDLHSGKIQMRFHTLEKAMDEIKNGDIVRLKSGGKEMTVTKVAKAFDSDELAVWVTWFDSKGNLQKEIFPPAALEILEKVTLPPIMVNPSAPLSERARRFFGNRGH